jgi:hypothetical protein
MIFIRNSEENIYRTRRRWNYNINIDPVEIDVRRKLYFTGSGQPLIITFCEQGNRPSVSINA